MMYTQQETSRVTRNSSVNASGMRGKKQEKDLVWYLGGMRKGKPSTKETLKKL